MPAIKVEKASGGTAVVTVGNLRARVAEVDGSHLLWMTESRLRSPPIVEKLPGNKPQNIERNVVALLVSQDSGIQ